MADTLATNKRQNTPNDIVFVSTAVRTLTNYERPPSPSFLSLELTTSSYNNMKPNLSLSSQLHSDSKIPDLDTSSYVQSSLV